jgi:hypothetical protein
VNYSTERPLMYRTAMDMVNKLVLEEIEFARMFTNRLVYTKNHDWSYEAEWRVYIPNFVPSGTGGEFLELHPEEITVLFFGCRTPAGEREKIRQLAKQLNPDMKFFQMAMAPRAYFLESERMLPESEPGR